jgi:hypothetical protein
VRSWSDNEFQCQFRLRREVFATCLGLLNVDLQRNEKMAKNSSGSSISPEMMFLITLRILAGASYLDMIWYRVSVKYVFDAIVFPTLVAIGVVSHACQIPTLARKRYSLGWSC